MPEVARCTSRGLLTTCATNGQTRRGPPVLDTSNRFEIDGAHTARQLLDAQKKVGARVVHPGRQCADLARITAHLKRRVVGAEPFAPAANNWRRSRLHAVGQGAVVEN